MNKICSFCGSDNYYAKGFCRKCYKRYRTNGSPEYKVKPNRKVYMCNLKGQVMRVFNNLDEAVELTGLNKSSLICALSGRNYSHKGCVFLYEGEPLPTHNRRIPCNVVATRHDGYKIRFNQVSDAIDYLKNAGSGATRQGIHAAINRPSRQYKGFSWTCDYV